MATGHGCEATYRLLCELFDEETSPQRREEITSEIAQCPECRSIAESERAVRAIVRDCCKPTKAPEPLRERIITTLSYTEVTWH